MNMFRGILTMSSVSFSTVATVRNVEPSSFSLVSEVNIATIMVSEPSPHTLRQLPNVLGRMFMQPMVQRAAVIVSPGSNVTRELSLEAREHIIERQSISSQVNPSGLSCKNSKSLSRPQTIAFSPVANIRNVSVHVLNEICNIEFPFKS